MYKHCHDCDKWLAGIWWIRVRHIFLCKECYSKKRPIVGVSASKKYSRDMKTDKVS